jgi:iron(III) transport system permease protein
VHGPFLLLAAVVAAPLVMLIHQAFADDRPWLGAVAPVVVTGMIVNTLVVGAVAVALATAIGTAAAVLIIRCRIPGRRWWSVLLCLPFAVPPFAYAAALAGGGGLSRHLPDGPLGCGLVLGLALYPWVFVPVKAALARHAVHLHHAAAAVGLSPWARWWRIEVPMLLPTIASAALLVLMAVLNDFGTAALLGVKTLSVGLHDAMFSMQRPDWAAQLALAGMAVPLAAAGLLAWAERRRGSVQPANRGAPAPRVVLPWWGSAAAILAILALLGAALVAPVAVLANRAVLVIERMPLAPVPGQVVDSVLLAGSVTLAAVAIALAAGLAVRRPAAAGWRHLGPFLVVVYAIPAAMLAVAFLLISGLLPRGLSALVLSETAILLGVAGIVAHLAFPWAAVRAGLGSVPRGSDDLCATLGLGWGARVRLVYAPLLRGHLAAGGLLVFVLMMQELPLTLILQPFDFQTLGLRLYDFARVEVLAPASVYALLIIGLLIYPVIAIDRLIMGDHDAAP